MSTGFLSAPPSDGNGGTGFDSMEGNKNAKNSLVIGSILDATDEPIVSATTSAFSSYGTSDDGRVKPDLVANGQSLTSSVASGDADYSIFSGTSMASPNAMGTATLLIQHYINLFGQNPLSATTKGLLIHNATDVNNVGPDYATGWGVIDAARAAQFLTNVDTAADGVMHAEDTYSASTRTYTFTSDGTTPLKATIAWTDPEGTAHPAGLDVSTAVLVNDLNLLVTGPGATTFFPWTLDRNSPATAAVRTQANSVDNVEQVLIDAPPAGTYTITVSGPGAVTQPFSMFVTGATEDNANENPDITFGGHTPRLHRERAAPADCWRRRGDRSR